MFLRLLNYGVCVVCVSRVAGFAWIAKRLHIALDLLFVLPVLLMLLVLLLLLVHVACVNVLLGFPSFTFTYVVCAIHVADVAAW